ncbi:MAG: TIGR02452 family protein [Desulfobacteraceae bacterium]|nr:TIGR02452 family protein [Desulfobacteraceae bacterium]
MSDKFSGNETVIEVTTESTLEAAHRLIKEYNCNHIACLNFASAKNPGGGFSSGSQAQEESGKIIGFIFISY